MFGGGGRGFHWRGERIEGGEDVKWNRERKFGEGGEEIRVRERRFWCREEVYGWGRGDSGAGGEEAPGRAV